MKTGHTRLSEGSLLIYFFMNSETHPICLVLSTAHFFFLIIGASPAGLRRTSTKKARRRSCLRYWLDVVISVREDFISNLLLHLSHELSKLQEQDNILVT